jgi:hypothetical protein
MMRKKEVVVMAGGAFAEQTQALCNQLTEILTDSIHLRIYNGGEAFRHLARCDSLLLLGCHTPQAMGMAYTPLQRQEKQLFGTFVGLGFPLLVSPEGSASFPDWPRYSELLGYETKWDGTSNGYKEFASATIRCSSLGGFCKKLDGVTLSSVSLPKIRPRASMKYDVLAWIENGEPVDECLVVTATGGPRPGAGRSVYVGLGPSLLGAVDQDLLLDLWASALMWAVGEQENSFASSGG